MTIEAETTDRVNLKLDYYRVGLNWAQTVFATLKLISQQFSKSQSVEMWQLKR
jgi:hypothetical protein